MKHTATLLLSLLLCLSLCLAGCPGGDGAYVLESSDTETFVCRETGVTYRRAPAVYLPMQLCRTPYARWQSPSGASFAFFALGEESAGRYLMLADEDDYYPYYLIVADGYTLPTPEEMAVSEVLLCGAESETFWHPVNIHHRIGDFRRIEALLAARADGESATLPGGTPAARVELIFVSEKYPELSYFCTYLSYGKGENYLYESDTRRTVRVPDGLILENEYRAEVE